MPTRKPTEEETVNADLLPVMNVMFLLIPALLLAMEFASMAQISIAVPRSISSPTSQPQNPTQPELGFKVTIGRDGFRTRSGGGDAGPGTIPMSGGDYDYAALAAAARDLKHLFPAESTVTITAEGDVPMDVLVRTIDVLRGDRCKLGGYTRGEQPGEECMFWSPVIESVG
ncbi:biopolymer transporter ExbD [Nannocystis punicea]|uniref:Biopolymer transporter ExbD n=1 Tax=Nannocystis punicea TaxID=2995304 RepID=A0ABY7HEJ2_9BACT|nr:biopolymer transporter ExbD [Nannocystis poenicansa]WAS97706.1 biopolymer transporter ExbD [Nannocystis poenicansa]